MTDDQAEKMRHALEAIAACGALNDDHLPEQRLMLEALRPFEGRWTVLTRAEEAENEVARLRTTLAALVEAYDVSGHQCEASNWIAWAPKPSASVAMAWSAAFRLLGR